MGGGGGEGRFTVTVSKEVVAAVLPLPEYWLPLSNLDLLLPSVDVAVFFCYKKPSSEDANHNFGSMVGVLKKAMAQVLVSFYAFAGEVMANSVGEPELLCNNRGVDFFEAFADIELKHLNLYNPDQSVESNLVPAKKAGVLAVQPQANADPFMSRIYYVKADELNQLQSLARRTKLESFSAFLWQMIAKCANKDNGGRNSKISKMGIVVDGRSRLSDESRTDKAKPMGAYFGNVLSIPYGSKRVGELIENPLSCVANEVHHFLENAVTKEHFLGLIDWVEAHRREPAVAKIYSSGSDEGPAFVVSSGQRFPVSKIDFGWGKPFFGSYHFPWRGCAGYVMPMPSPAGNNNGDWIVYMHLMKGQIEFIESEAEANLFRPLTYDYLNQSTSPY